VPKDIDRLEKGSEWSGPHFRQNPEAKGVALRAGVRSLAVFRRAPVPGARRIGGGTCFATTPPMRFALFALNCSADRYLAVYSRFATIIHHRGTSTDHSIGQ
jgi:hypothetical protein